MCLGRFAKITRVDFLPASLVPFLIGAAFAAKGGYAISLIRFIPALIGVVSAHLAGNVLNNYYDHVLGADNRDVYNTPFFGGSGLIYEGAMSPREVLVLGLALLAAAVLCGLFIFGLTGDPIFPALMAAGGILAWGYTAPPLKLAYRRLGEVDIFLLFGVLLVVGGYYLFSESFTPASFLISLPVSFLVLCVILCNEVPDIETDIEAGKYNLVTFAGGERAFIIYTASLILGAVSIALNVLVGNLPVGALGLLVLFVMSIRAACILKRHYSDPERLIPASKMTIALHAATGIGIIVFLII